MGKVATTLGIAVIAVGAGALGAFGYDQLTGDDAPVVQQAPLAAGAQSSNQTESTGLTPAEIYAKASPGVVLIQAAVTESVTSPFGEQQQQQGESTGTGFVVSKDGYIVTNAHVVQGATKAVVKFGEDKEVAAVIKGTDANSDLAVLKVNPDDHELTPLELGTVEGIKVGDPVVAIGNPFGLDRTLTTGVVSALARQIKGLNGFSINNVVQTDAAINKGNSGGPLIDATGKVIGVNSQIQTESGGNVGIGFAVPVDRVKAVLPTLEQGKQVQVAFLGVTAMPIDGALADVIKLKQGLLVVKVTKGSAADKAGLKAGDSQATVQIQGVDVNLGGDVILSVDGKELETAQALSDYIASRKVGDKVTIVYQRGSDKKTVEVELGNRPSTVATD